MGDGDVRPCQRLSLILNDKDVHLTDGFRECLNRQLARPVGAHGSSKVNDISKKVPYVRINANVKVTRGSDENEKTQQDHHDCSV